MVKILSQLKSIFISARTDVLTCHRQEFVSLTRAIMRGSQVLPSEFLCPGPVYIALRSAGKQLYEKWHDNPTLTWSLADAVDAVPRASQTVDAVELVLSYRHRTVPETKLSKFFASRHRGLCGMEIRFAGEDVRYGPTQMVICNQGFRMLFERFLDRHGISEAYFFANGGRIRRFQTRQVVISSRPTPNAVELYRGNRLVSPVDITGHTVNEMISAMTGWCIRQISPEGRLCCDDQPGPETGRHEDNITALFRVSRNLIQLARQGGDDRKMAIARRNLGYNLKTFMKNGEDDGLIESDGVASPGASAMAGLALLELPTRDAEMHDCLDRLQRGIRRLTRANGSFRGGAEKGNEAMTHNRDSGTVLLFQAEQVHRQADPGLLERLKGSMEFYRLWHLNDRHPSFVPLHTQACVRLYDFFQDRALVELVFDMNDWLLSMQQWRKVPCPDMKGRFYDPTRPHFGAPCAATTASCLQGLIAAWRLAEQVGDRQRVKTYGKAIWRGVFNLRQLQFLDEADAWYVANRKPVDGGVRTDIHDNEIRIENVGNALAALMALRDLGPVFQAAAGDWR